MNFEKPEETAIKGIRCFRRFLHDIGLPINLAELGAKEEDIPVLVKNQNVQDRTWGFVRLSADDITEIYRIAAKAQV